MCGTRCLNLLIAPRNCGACGNVCGPGQQCVAGACTTANHVNGNTTGSCAAGKTMCGTRCLNLLIAPRNCGACGNVCGPGQPS
jgi:hypothetical protein